MMNLLVYNHRLCPYKYLLESKPDSPDVGLNLQVQFRAPNTPKCG